MGPKVILVDDEDHLRNAVSQTFDLAGLPVESFDNAQDALAQIDTEFDGVVVSDIRMPGMDGVEMLGKVMSLDADIPVVLITGHGDVDMAVQCIKTGAYDFIEKPWQPERLVNCVKQAMERRRLTLENRQLREQVLSSKSWETVMHGRSAAMDALRQRLAAVAATDVDVLITGATGAGKEVAARMLHRESARAKGPFVHVNCAALPDALIESELFGHEAGAFPGATRSRFGRLEHARGGILCLDEIDLLPMPLQAKLLDVLHNRTVTRLGSNDPVSLDIRVVALSKNDLEAEAREGRFRPDLLYRLNVATLTIPPLSDRREDIPGLFVVLATEVAKQHDLSTPDIAPTTLSALAGRDWPGNVRELRNAAERFVLGLSEVVDGEIAPHQSLNDRMNAYEKAQIAAAISANKGRLKETYEALGLSRKTLYDKMQKHGLSRGDFQSDR